MNIDRIYFKQHRCFKNDWAGFDEIKPINVIIGRNNTGKSNLLELIDAVCSGKWAKRGWRFKCHGTLTEPLLKHVFPENTSGGVLGGNHWRDHGCLFVNKSLTWELDETLNPVDLEWENNFNPASRHGEASTQARLEPVHRVLKQLHHPLTGKSFRRLFADRDIRPEQADVSVKLDADGSGATNIIRRYIVTSNPKYPREIIQKKLLAALNEIFAGDGHFTEIQVKHHDEPSSGKTEGHWEIFLGEAKKGLIPLTSSGSGLKTILLVLINLLVVPKMDEKPDANYVFAFEELENNLHPALIRRLLQYIERFAVGSKTPVFLTTHSSTALDLFGGSPNAQIIHVTHDGESAKTQKVSASFEKLGVIADLGAKPSDLLQANGIIWVEGPSDSIYINRWIDLYTAGKLQEGRDYQCAFYGGALLARTQFVPPEEAEKELVNLFRVNPNIIVVCDGDRSSKGARVKERVRRIRSEVMRIPNAHIWVTGAREIENYIPGEILAKYAVVENLSDPSQYEQFFPRKGMQKASYLEKRMKRNSIDKVELASVCASYMSLASMRERFDWDPEMKKIVERIQVWNR